jgi:hypothetical protein
MKTPPNGTNQMIDLNTGPADTLLALHAELVRLEDLAKHYSLTEVELLVGAAAQATSEALNRKRPMLN